jgi:hypothetical protein
MMAATSHSVFVADATHIGWTTCFGTPNVRRSKKLRFTKIEASSRFFFLLKMKGWTLFLPFAFVLHCLISVHTFLKGPLTKFIHHHAATGRTGYSCPRLRRQRSSR